VQQSNILEKGDSLICLTRLPTECPFCLRGAAQAEVPFPLTMRVVPQGEVDRMLESDLDRLMTFHLNQLRCFKIGKRRFRLTKLNLAARADAFLDLHS
jgi:hypothetical protein